MKTREQINEIHDLLEAVVYDEVKIPIANKNSKQILHAWLDALCWVLDHNNAAHMESYLKEMSDLIEKCGYRKV